MTPSGQSSVIAVFVITPKLSNNNGCFNLKGGYCKVIRGQTWINGVKRRVNEPRSIKSNSSVIEFLNVNIQDIAN